MMEKGKGFGPKRWFRMMNILAILLENVPFLGMMNFGDPNSKVGVR